MCNFDISNAAKVTITANKTKTFHRTDLKVKIKGGEVYSNRIVPLLDMSCDTEAREEGSYCYIGNNKWCDHEVFNRNYYCAKCIDTDTTPGKCEKKTIDCDSVTFPCDPDDITCSGMTVKARVSGMHHGIVSINTYTLADDFIETKKLSKDEEICIDSNGKFISSPSPDCKMALHLEDRNPDGGIPPFWVKITKGCY